MRLLGILYGLLLAAPLYSVNETYGGTLRRITSTSLMHVQPASDIIIGALLNSDAEQVLFLTRFFTAIQQGNNYQSYLNTGSAALLTGYLSQQEQRTAGYDRFYFSLIAETATESRLLFAGRSKEKGILRGETLISKEAGKLTIKAISFFG